MFIELLLSLGILGHALELLFPDRNFILRQNNI